MTSTDRANERDKAERLVRLARRRRSEVPAGYRDISQFHQGRYDCDFVSPWSKSANNLSADLMIIAQDWASEEFLNRPFNPRLAEAGHDEELATNVALRAVLKEHLGLEFGQTYATNVFPFIKRGKMNATIPRRDLIEAARKFALPQIEIVRPLLAVCLGIRTFDAVRAAMLAGADEPPMTWAAYESTTAGIRYGPTEIYAATHLGATGRIGRKNRIEPEWNFIARRLAERRGDSSGVGGASPARMAG